MSTLLEIRTTTRTTLDDTSTVDQLWTDIELNEYINDAENQSCKIADLLIDSTTASTCDITLVSGTATYSISPLILKILRAFIDGSTRPLVQTTKRVLDLTYALWASASGDERSFFIGDTNKLTIYKKPDGSGTLRLTISRLPLVAMSADGDSPEIDAQYHDGMIDWVLYRAYSKQDSKTLDPEKAEIHKNVFNERFGIKPPVKEQREGKR